MTEQVTYSIFSRAIEADVLPITQQYRMGVLVWSPLANGWLAGTVTRDQPVTTHRAALARNDFDLTLLENQRKLDIVDALRDIAADLQVSLAELGLAFATSHPAVTSVLVGPRTPEHLRQNLKAADLTLDDATLDKIDQLVAPGTDVAPQDRYPVPPKAITNPRLRRR